MTLNKKQIGSLSFFSLDRKNIFDDQDLTALDQDGRTDTPYSKPRQNGLTYMVARSGKTKIIPDMKKDPVFKIVPKDWHGSIVSIPLKIGERVVGVMNISRPKPGPFTRDEIRIWNLFSNQAAIAIENARLFEGERKQNERIEALHSAVTAINSSLELSDVLDFILTELRRVIPYDSASIMLIDSDMLRVAGVAHELNNPLTSIIGIAQILQTYEVNREISDYLESLVKEAHRTANIVRSLLDFARQRKPNKEVIEIHQVLKSVFDILAYDLRSNNINLVTDFSPDVPSIMPSRLRLLLL